MYNSPVIGERKKRVLLASIIPQKLSTEEALVELEELKSLVDAYGAEVVELVVQKREVHSKGHYLGRGKVEEIASLLPQKDIDIVVLNSIVKPDHLFEMKKVLRKKKEDIEVWDRVDLILEIFAHHANTAESRLQIDLAAMRHMGPRIYGMGYVLSRQGGNIGTRGIGETNTELMKRHWREQMRKIQDKLGKLSQERERQMERRRKNGMQTVSIIGYTNAGKTSLFNLLTKKDKLVENQLFATLDTSVARLFLPSIQKEVLLTDTIGFIKNLPARLIDAFKSTLMESIHADLLLHVIDASDPTVERKVKAVEDVLWDLGVHYKPRIYVFNKVDKISPETQGALKEQFQKYSPLFISVKEERGIEELLSTLADSLRTRATPLTQSS